MKVIRNYPLLLLIVLLISCGVSIRPGTSNTTILAVSTESSYSAVTTIPFQKTSSIASASINFVNMPITATMMVPNQKLSLYVYGIYAIDSNNVFLFGNVTYRSILLRSVDRGKTWQESAMTEEKCYPCTISHVVFIGDGAGWAIMEEEGEGGEMYIWHTDNYGIAWKKITEMPRGIAKIEGFEFIDINHGRMVQTIFRQSNLDGISIFTTSDGGYNWEVSFNRSFPINLDGQSRIQLLDSYLPVEKGGFFGNHWDTLGGSTMALGQDGSQWVIENKFGPTDEKKVYVRTRSLGETEWTTYSLPFELRYDNGLIIVP